MLGIRLILDMYLPKVNSLIHFFLVFFSQTKTRMNTSFSLVWLLAAVVHRVSAKGPRLGVRSTGRGRADAVEAANRRLHCVGLFVERHQLAF